MGSVKSILRDRLILKIKQYLYNTFYLTTIENLETNFTKIPTSDYYSNVHKYTKNIIYLFNNLTKRIGFFISFISTCIFFLKKSSQIGIIFIITYFYTKINPCINTIDFIKN